MCFVELMKKWDEITLFLLVFIAVQVTRLYANVETLKTLCSLRKFEVYPPFQGFLGFGQLWLEHPRDIGVLTHQEVSICQVSSTWQLGIVRVVMALSGVFQMNRVILCSTSYHV